MKFNWNEEKNSILKEKRHISFEQVVIAIEEGHIVDILKHPNSKRYPNQFIILVEINYYIYAVPAVEHGEEYFLKTIFPSRKYSEQYLRYFRRKR